MTMKSAFETVFGLLGGLALFIFGMNMMSECLQKVAGDKMKKILALLTKNPVLGVLAGALTTAVLQSSSAATVMAIGFVSAGLMSLPQAISIILGANIGTTMTAQIIAFKITDYIQVFIFAGFLLSFTARRERLKNIGQTLFAFGLLFLGIETMGGVMKPLASSGMFDGMIGRVSDMPILGVAVGTLMTLVVQSSSATIAVLQNFASQAGADGVSSVLGLTGAIPILLGDNIGTTITALLASVGQSKDAKRTAAAHCVFNISGCLLFIWFIEPFATFVRAVSPKGAEIDVISRQIANAHTAFNITMTVIWIPLIWLMVRIVMRLIPDRGEARRLPSQPLYLDNNLIGQPAAALRLVARETDRCAKLAGRLLRGTADLVGNAASGAARAAAEQKDDISSLAASITEYLAEMFAAGVLTEDQATETAGLMCVLGEVERVGELCADTAELLRDAKERRLKFSKTAESELRSSLTMLSDMYDKITELMQNGGSGDLEEILALRGRVLDLDIHMRKKHMSRVAKGKCPAELTMPFNEILHNIDRLGNSCLNIAETVSDKVDLGYFEPERTDSGVISNGERI